MRQNEKIKAWLDPDLEDVLLAQKLYSLRLSKIQRCEFRA